MSFNVGDLGQERHRERRRGGNDYSKSPADDYNTAEYLSWRRLHLSKSKLTNVAEMASFMAGFAVVATVELQINDQDASPPLLTAFVITTALLVGTCMIAIIISTCVLPHLEAVAKTSEVSGANQSPHDKMMRLIDISWVLTNSASLFFFTLDIILMCWIKYTFFSRGASIAATVIMAPVLFIIIIFAYLFYRRIVKHQYVISSLKCEELERMHEQLERTASLSSMSYQGTITSNYQTVTSMNNQRWLQQNHPYYSGTSQGSPTQSQSQYSPPQQPSPPNRQHRSTSTSHHHHLPFQSLRNHPRHSRNCHCHGRAQNMPYPVRSNHNNNNNNYFQFSPTYFTTNPNVFTGDSPKVPHSASVPATPTMPMSPSWSDQSNSPDQSVFTV